MNDLISTVFHRACVLVFFAEGEEPIFPGRIRVANRVNNALEEQFHNLLFFHPDVSPVGAKQFITRHISQYLSNCQICFLRQARPE